MIKLNWIERINECLFNSQYSASRIILIVLLVLSNGQIMAQTFKVIPLGIYGGSDESNLSAYMVGAATGDAYICLDAGTLHTGIQKAIDKKVFSGTVSNVLKTNIKGYLISHPHLDHLSGLILNSPDDTSKNIYGLPFCLDVIADKYFSWKSWANFGDKGETPMLKKYHYVALSGEAENELANTGLFVKAFELSHSSPDKSSAFLVRKDSSYLLYLGDTGSDEIEKSTKLMELWQAIAPLVEAKQLKGIFIETSFPNAQPTNKLFGHFTPALLMKELQILSGLSNGLLVNVPIIVTHIKPIGNNETIIKKELQELNLLKLKLIFPKQGKRFLL